MLTQGKKGSLVPFGLQLLRPEILYAAGRPQEALEGLYEMLQEYGGSKGGKEKEEGADKGGQDGGDVGVESGVHSGALGLPTGGGRRRAVMTSLVGFFPAEALLQPNNTTESPLFHILNPGMGHLSSGRPRLCPAAATLSSSCPQYKLNSVWPCIRPALALTPCVPKF